MPYVPIIFVNEVYFVTVIAKYFNIVTFFNNLLAVFILFICPLFCKTTWRLRNYFDVRMITNETNPRNLSGYMLHRCLLLVRVVLTLLSNFLES